MKINDNSICSIIVSKHFREFHIEYTKKNFLKEMNENQKRTTEEKIKFHNESGFRILVFSKKSKDNLENYIIPTEIRLNVLRSLPNRKDVIQIDSSNCIKYIKTDDNLSFITCYRKSDEINSKPTTDNMIHTHFFNIDLKNGVVGTDESDTYNNVKIKDVKTLIEKYYSRFLLVVTYLELTDVTLNIIEGSTSKNKKSNLTISNSSRFNVIHVNTNWNVETISLLDIRVRGHWRLQPYGVGRSQYKYIYIKPFDKGLTRRLSQKELIN